MANSKYNFSLLRDSWRNLGDDHYIYIPIYRYKDFNKILNYLEDKHRYDRANIQTTIYARIPPKIYEGLPVYLSYDICRVPIPDLIQNYQYCPENKYSRPEK
jgi:hypothetical protein